MLAWLLVEEKDDVGETVFVGLCMLNEEGRGLEIGRQKD